MAGYHDFSQTPDLPTYLFIDYHYLRFSLPESQCRGAVLVKWGSFILDASAIAVSLAQSLQGLEGF